MLACSNIQPKDLHFGNRKYEWPAIVSECEIEGPFRAVQTLAQSVGPRTFLGRLLTAVVEPCAVEIEKADLLGIIVNLIGMLHGSKVPIRMRGSRQLNHLETYSIAATMYEELTGSSAGTMPMSIPSATVRSYMRTWNCSADQVERNLAMAILKNLDL